MTVQDQMPTPQDDTPLVPTAPEWAASPVPFASPAMTQITKAIAAVMKEIHMVSKRGHNAFHRYRYARMEDILRQLTPLLGKHGLVIFQDEVGRSMFDNDAVIAVSYEFVVAHESGEAWPQRLRQTGVSRCRDSKGGWDDKSLNKCHTAARKYFLLALFQIPTGDEEDADHTGVNTNNVTTDSDQPSSEAMVWTTKFLARVRQSTTATALDRCISSNRAALERLADVAPNQRKIIDEAIERRKSDLAPRSKELPPLVKQPAAAETSR